MKFTTKQSSIAANTRTLRKTAAQIVDECYFAGYDEDEIHELMIADLVRVEAYREAIHAVAKDKIIIDVGAGRGILSIMAAEAGATKVYAIEKSR